MSDRKLIDKEELHELLRESVKANATNSATSKSIARLQRQLKDEMCEMNDNFVLHRTDVEEIRQNVNLIKKDLLKWLKVAIVLIFALTGGIIIAKSLGLDLVKLITTIG